MSKRLTTIDISKEDLKFSCAHFTIFSESDRERLHGHNFKVRATVTAPVYENGLCFDYQEIKSRLRSICKKLDEYVLLPGESPYLKIEQVGDQYEVIFNGENLFFAVSDTQVLAIRNTTVEELSFLVLEQMIKQDNFFLDSDVESMTIGVSSGDGQWGSYSWATTDAKKS
ncbi:MAG: 6-pyruvoyl tetrahydropterin synthase [Cellvibrionales bacterium]|nr:6-pyruvoyl tetrahydropterin synthase [Cellvibrionales bacterium]